MTDEDLQALMADEVHQPTVIWELMDLQVGGWGEASWADGPAGWGVGWCGGGDLVG